MNAIPHKPLEADPAAWRDGKPLSDSEGENVRLTIDFEDEPEDSIGPGTDSIEAARTASKGSAFAEPGRAQGAGPNTDTDIDPRPAAEALQSGAAQAEQQQASAARRRPAPQPGTQSAPQPELQPERQPGTGSGTQAPPATANAGTGNGNGLNVPPQLAGIEVTLTVEIGSHRLPLKDLLSVDPGQLFALDRMTTEPVSILVNGKPFAQGEIVAIGDRFGVRLLDIVEPKAS